MKSKFFTLYVLKFPKFNVVKPLQSQNIFETWNDTNAETMNKDCIGAIKRSYNSYASEMNTRMRIYMHAQNQIEDAMHRLSNINK